MTGEATKMLSYILWGAVAVGLLNLAAIVALLLAYAWHHGVKPKVSYRRARQHAFELLLARTSIENILESRSP